MQRVGIVFLGGGLGSCLRAALLAWPAPTDAAPVLLANLLGAFMLGVVFVLAQEAGLLQRQARLFLAVGVLGGFTTFSTFGWGVDTLLAQNAIFVGVGYLIASIGGGVAAVAVGLAAGRKLVVMLERLASGLLGRLEDSGFRRAGDSRAGMYVVETRDRDASA